MNLKPDYQPKSVNTDGWEHTQRAWKDLFPGIAVILCFLHAFLNIRDRCKRHKELLRSISEKVWDIYHAETVAQFSQRIRRLRQWASAITIDSVQDKVLKLCDKAPPVQESFLSSPSSRYEPKRPVETGANVCNANRHDQSMVKETGSHICQRTVSEHSLSGHGPIVYMNRPVRTRMPGGVGAGG